MIPSRHFNRSKNVPFGRSSNRSIESTRKPPDLALPVTPDTSSRMCNEYTAQTMRPPEHNSSWNLPASNDLLDCSSPSVVSLLLETDDNDEDPVPVFVNENDPSEHVVVKDGYTFYIRYVDEPNSEEPLVQRSSADEDACEVESIPSISCELSRLLDDSMLPEGAITTLDHPESPARDWINYDELPLLLNQQKQQQQQQQCSASSTDHVSVPPSDTLVEDERTKYGASSVLAKRTERQVTNIADISGCCETFPSTTPLEGFSQHNGTTGHTNSSSGLTADVTTVPDFSHYCVECEKFFPSNDLLQVHMEFNHRLFGEDDALIAMAASSTPRRPAFTQAALGYGGGSGESGGLVWPCTAIVDSTNQCPKRAFFCDLCNISFDLVESYYMHNHSVHGGGRIGTDYR